MTQTCGFYIEAASKASAYRPALMENCYSTNRGPLVPGAQPLARNKALDCDNSRFVPAPGDRRRFGQRAVRVTAAPAAALKLLYAPMPGAPVAICKAPLSCRLSASAMPMVKPELVHARNEDASFMIPTPTGSISMDSMPSTPYEGLQGNRQGMFWPPRSAAEAARHAPSGQHVANVYNDCHNATPCPMPVLHLSAVIPNQQYVQCAGPGLQPSQQCERPTSNHAAPQKFPSTGPYGSSESTSASSGSGHIEAGCDPAMPKTELGSAELPSRGSALHAWKACKPCAFMFQEGCANKEECEFCHLCEPGERKRRKKERRVQKRDSREQAAYGTQRTQYVDQFGMR